MNYSDCIYEAVRKENGNKYHVSLISILFEPSFLLDNETILHDHRALFPLLSLVPVNLMILLTLYLNEDEERLFNSYKKSYGEKRVISSTLDPLTIITLNQNFTGNPHINLLPNIIQVFRTDKDRYKYLGFLLGIDNLLIDDSLPLVQKLDSLITQVCPTCDISVKDALLSLISTNDKKRALEILSNQIYRYKEDTTIFLINKLIDELNG
jgi:hypothetical protein